MKTQNKVLAAAVAMALSGCATVAPRELVQARDSFQKSSQGATASLMPTDLYEARKTLDAANREFDEHGDTAKLRDLACVAELKVEIADGKARTEVDRKAILSAQKQGVKVRDELVAQARDELKMTRQQIEEQKRALDEQMRTNSETAAQLESEKAKRQSAEEQLKAAMKDLTTVAAVKEESRGVVITLNGSVLFPSGKSQLLETAKTRLDQVADALKQEPETKSITVEGHTDNVGTQAYNDQLSMARATSVRDYLVQRGVDAKRIDAKGYAFSRPLVDNSSAENRANNRRVEIVVHDSTPVAARE